MDTWGVKLSACSKTSIVSVLLIVLSGCNGQSGSTNGGENPPPPGSAPEIVGEIDFPNVIPPDGRKQIGSVRFKAGDADVEKLRLEVVQGDEFSNQEVEIREFGRLDLLGPDKIGRIEFELSSSKPQQLVRIAAILTDKKSQQSKSKEFSFSVQGTCVSPDPPAPCEVIRVTEWGRSGSSENEFRSPRQLAVDLAGNVYVADMGNHRIQVFDQNGNHRLTSRGGSGIGSGIFNNPYAIAIDRDGNILVADTMNHQIQKLSPTGSQLKFREEQEPERKEVFTVGGYGTGTGQLFSPMAIAADNQGNFYVADTNNHRIVKFDFQGYWEASWGEAGNLVGKFNYPRGIAIDAMGNVYVVDGENHRIQKFDSNGNLSPAWGSHGSLPGQFDQPWGIAVDPKGSIYVVDRGNARVQKFDKFGKFLMAWGRSGNAPGEFSNPIGIAIDSRGYIYVSDSGNNRIQKFWVNK